MIDVVAAAVAGGVSSVQLREKSLPTREFVERARALKILLAEMGYGTPLIINDRLDVALACGADGIHVGQDDMPIDVIRQWFPAGIVGLSIESIKNVEMVAAQQLDIDYLGISPIFSTYTKLDAAAPIGIDGLLAIRRLTKLPLVAIGGVNLENAASLLESGADGLAIVSAICSADDPERAARDFSAVIRSAKMQNSCRITS